METPENKAPDNKTPENKEGIKSQIESEKKEFGEKKKKLNKAVEKKGGWSKFANENSGKISGAGMFLFGLFTGLIGFMFLGGGLFCLD